MPVTRAGVLLIAAVIIAEPARGQHRAALEVALPARRAAPPTPLGKPFDPQQPPARSESSRVTLQFLAASAGAVGGGLGGYLVLRDASQTRVKGDEGYTRSGNVGYLIGSFAGSILGAHLVGTRMGGKSPLWATSLGALVGTSPLIALGIDEPYLPLFGIVLGWIPQGALATGGFVMGEPR